MDTFFLSACSALSVILCVNPQLAVNASIFYECGGRFPPGGARRCGVRRQVPAPRPEGSYSAASVIRRG